MKIYFTLTGTKYYQGSSFMEPGTRVYLRKEPDNEYDKEAIRVEMPGLGKVGYVANSAHTVIGECLSAQRGRLQDREKMAEKVSRSLCTFSLRSALRGKRICGIRKRFQKKPKNCPCRIVFRKGRFFG